MSNRVFPGRGRLKKKQRHQENGRSFDFETLLKCFSLRMGICRIILPNSHLYPIYILVAILLTQCLQILKVLGCLSGIKLSEK